MPDRDAFLAAINAAPADDAPRLVFADWLDEHGQPERAAFIRDQIHGREPGRRFAAYSFDSTNLPPRHSFVWYWDGGVPPKWARAETFPGQYDRAGVYSRGFIGIVEVVAADWLAHADAILAAHPVTEVRLTTEPDLRAHGFDFSLPGRSQRGRRAADETESWRPLCLRLLAAEWPSVKTWHLPPAPTP